MGHRGEKQTMTKVAAAFVMVLLVLEVAAFSSAGSSVNTRRALSASTDQPSTIAVDLMDFQHVDSPYMLPNLTLTERWQISVESSKQRLEYFSSKVFDKQTTIGNQSNPRRQMANTFTSPLASTQGSYIMQISVGTPASTFVAIADTGSDLVWLQCSTCTQCLQQPDTAFDPSASSTYTSMPCSASLCTDLSYDETPCPSTNTCGYNYTYSDSSFTYGDMAYETFTFTSTDGSATPFENIGFGCGTDDEGTFNQTDGLVGLGNGPLSLVSQLGSNIGSVFSYCLVDYYAATTKTSPLLLGSAGSLTKVYTPLVGNTFNPTNYYVNLMGITVNGQQVDYPSDTFTLGSDGAGGIILDSGTTLTYLFEAAYTPFVDAVSALISYTTVSNTDFDLCYDLSSVSNPVFPVVVFQFDSLSVTLPTANTFLEIDTQGTYCFPFASAGDPSTSTSIFGNVQQQNFEIAYDILNSQVGFAATTC